MASVEAFHGYKTSRDWESIAAVGLRRTEAGAGNYDPDWQALYLAATPATAAGYATTTDYEGTTVIRHAGGVLHVSLNGIQVADVTREETDLTGDPETDAERALTLRDRLGLPQSKPLLDALGATGRILRVGAHTDGDRQAQTRHYEEVIVPWSIAEDRSRCGLRRIIAFTDDRRGADAAEHYAHSGTLAAAADRAHGVAYRDSAAATASRLP